MLQQNSCSKSVMPLLMGFTPKTRIEIGEVNENFSYDETLQITEYDMVTVGTKCLKNTMTNKGPKYGSVLDKKNEIDDSKTK